jgi:hypothetical protein
MVDFKNPSTNKSVLKNNNFKAPTGQGALANHPLMAGPTAPSSAPKSSITKQNAGPSTKGPFSYPKLDRDRHHAKVIFQAVKVEPPSFSSGDVYSFSDISNVIKSAAASASNEAFNLRDQTSEEATQADIDAQSAAAADPKYYNNERSYQQSGKAKERTNPTIEPTKIELLDGEKAELYLPVSFAVNDRFNYENVNLNIAGAAALNAAGAGGGFLGSLGSAISEGFGSIGEFFSSLNGGDISRIAAVRALNAPGISTMVPESVKNAISIAGGVSLNPNTRAAFRSVGLREFTFQFKFIPKTQDEAEEVKKIIKFFRYHAYPEHITPGESNLALGYKYPNLFKIKLMYDATDTGWVKNKSSRRWKPIGGQIKMCYLRNVSANYNPTTMAMHSDGNFVESDITLNFVEYRTLHRGDLIYDDFEYDPDLEGAQGVFGSYEDNAGGYDY